jgi:CRP-like cAMP-binding protein
MRGLRQSPPRLVLLSGQRGRLADLELATSTISLPAQASLFTQGEDARCLYLICGGYLKLTAGRTRPQMIVRVAGPGSMLGLYAVLSHGVYEVSAESLTTAQLRPVERDSFLSFLRSHKEAQMRAVQCICQEYRFALQDACRIALAETVAARLGRCSWNWPTRSANTWMAAASASRCC